MTKYTVNIKGFEVTPPKEGETLVIVNDEVITVKEGDRVTMNFNGDGCIMNIHPTRKKEDKHGGLY